MLQTVRPESANLQLLKKTLDAEIVLSNSREKASFPLFSHLLRCLDRNLFHHCVTSVIVCEEETVSILLLETLECLARINR